MIANHKVLLITATALFIVAGAGCATHPASASSHSGKHLPGDHMGHNSMKSKVADQEPQCPLGVPGTKVSTQAIGDAVALVFTNDQGHNNELHSRVKQLVAYGGSQSESALPCCSDQSNLMSGDMTDSKGQLCPMSQAKGSLQDIFNTAGVSLEDTSNGDTLLFVPNDEQSLASLAIDVTEYAQMMNSDACPLKKDEIEPNAYSTIDWYDFSDPLGPGAIDIH